MDAENPDVADGQGASVADVVATVPRRADGYGDGAGDAFPHRAYLWEAAIELLLAREQPLSAAVITSAVTAI